MKDILTFTEMIIQNFMTFRSKQSLRLDVGSFVTVFGLNLDIGENERNGAGKSVIIDALFYCLFGKTLRQLPNKELTNWDSEKNLKVIVHFKRGGYQYRVERGENPALLHFYRQPEGCTDPWAMLKDGKRVYAVVSPKKKDTTKEIEAALGMDYVLAKILLATSSESPPFFEQESEDQRKIIEGLFSFTIMSDRAGVLRDKRRDANNELVSKTSALEATRQANKRIESEIASLEERAKEWEASKEANLRALHRSIKTIRNSNPERQIDTLKRIDDLEKTASTCRSERDRAYHELGKTRESMEAWDEKQRQRRKTLIDQIQNLSAINPEEETRIFSEIDRINTIKSNAMDGRRNAMSALSESTRILNGAERDIVRLTAVLTQLSEDSDKMDSALCPTCGQHWEAEVSEREKLDHAMAEAIAELDRLNNEKAIQEAHITLANDTIAGIELLMTAANNDLKAVGTPSVASLQEVSRIAAILESARQSLSELDTEENPFSSSLEEKTRVASETLDAAEVAETTWKEAKDSAGVLTYSSVEDATRAIAKATEQERQLKRMKEESNPHLASIEGLREKAIVQLDDSEIRILSERIEHMTFLIDLLSDKDSFIRKSILSRWLPKLNSYISTYLLKKELPFKVIINADTTATILKDERPVSYRALSKGMRSKLWMATHWAFQDVYELMNNRINLQFVDELLDSALSERGALASYDILRDNATRKNKSLFLITHRQDLADRAEKVLTVVLEYGESRFEWS